MPVIYYKHERRDWECTLLILYTNGGATFAIPSGFEDEEWMYLCVVYRGKVYAGRKLKSSYGGGYTRLECDPFNDNETGKQILLKHFLQGD